MTLGNALKLGACSAAASLSQPGASDGVSNVLEVMKLYEQFN